MLEYDESGIRIRPLTAEEQAKAEKAELELSIRRNSRSAHRIRFYIHNDLREEQHVVRFGSRKPDAYHLHSGFTQIVGGGICERCYPKLSLPHLCQKPGNVLVRF